jgi:pSer/pThr/pTyr-binding forkhead associated (FHA) protein
MEAYLEVFRSDGDSERVELVGDRLTIGRGEANDVILPDDPTVSRRHAVFERLAAGWCVSDLDSLNGTLVNGAALGQARPLYSGDEIQVGETRMVYRQR